MDSDCKEIQPRAVMLENVRGFLDSGFDEYRDHIFTSIQKLGYVTHIKLLNTSDYGVPQLRPRVVIIGIRKDQIGAFAYPDEQPDSAPTVGDTLRDLMAQNGWEGAKQWVSKIMNTLRFPEGTPEKDRMSIILASYNSGISSTNVMS